MERRTVFATAILVLMAIQSALPTAAPASPLGTGRESSCTLEVAALSPTREGVVASLTLRVREGYGRVYVSASSAVDVDLHGVARIAVMASSMVLGFNPLGYDYYFEIDAPAPVIEGSSIGAAMALALGAIITGADCEKLGLIAVGAIYPDATIGPVEGLLEKLEAAARAGAEVFVVPAGQIVYTRTRVVEEAGREGPLVLVARGTVTETVDLAREGERLGVRVLEARSIIDLYSIAFGYTKPHVGAAKPHGLPLREKYELLLNETTVLLCRAESEGAGSSDLLSLVSNASAVAERGYPYAGMLVLARASAVLEHRIAIAKVQQEPMRPEDLAGELSTVERELEQALRIYESAGYTSLQDLYLKIAAYIHLWRAYYALYLAKTETVGEAGASRAIELLSTAKWEARLAASLLDSAPLPGPVVSRSSVRALERLLSPSASSLAAYASRALREAGLPGLTDYSLRLASSTLAPLDEAGGVAVASLALASISSELHEALVGSRPVDHARLLAESLASVSRSSLGMELAEAGALLESYELLVLSAIISWATSVMDSQPRSLEGGEEAEESPRAGVLRRVPFTVWRTLYIGSLVLALVMTLVVLVGLAKKRLWSERG